MEGDTLKTAKEKLIVSLDNDENLNSLSWVTHSVGSTPEIVVMKLSFQMRGKMVKECRMIFVAHQRYLAQETLSSSRSIQRSLPVVWLCTVDHRLVFSRGPLRSSPVCVDVASL